MIMVRDMDIITGIESDIETVLVLSGVTAEDELQKVAYTPTISWRV